MKVQAIAALMASLRIGDIVKCFNGDGDIAIWINKLKMVARIQKLGDLQDIIPLFLDGAAFAVYEQMAKEDKEDPAKIERTLLDAFAMNAFQAYESFSQRRWQDGEPADVYLADLVRLARLANVENENLIRCAFIVGLPWDVSSKLRASAKIENCSLSEIVQQARTLMTERIHGGAFTTVAKYTPNREVPPKPQLSSRASSVKQYTKKCTNCNGDHAFRNCPTVKCFQCGENGHISRDCLNGQGESRAPPASQSSH